MPNDTPSTSSKRTPSNVSMEEDGPQPKNQRTDVDEAPAWAKQLLEKSDQICSKMDDLSLSLNTLQNTVARHEEQIGEVVQKIEENICTIEAVDADVGRAKAENHALRVELDALREQVNGLQDEQLRCTLVFYGIPQAATERAWDWGQAAEVLATWLSRHTSRLDKNFFSNNIVRCHRGAHNPSKPGPRPMHAKFTWSCADEIMKDIGLKQVDGVRVQKCFSRATQDRRNDALVFRRQYREEHAGAKVKLDYPATLMKKLQGDTKYSLLKKY